MANSKIQNLTALTTPLSTDVAVVVNDPSGSPTDRSATLANVITKAHGLSDGLVKVATATMAPAVADTDYLTPGTAASTYLTQANAATTYAALSGATFTGAISATNLSGTNTGDQDLSGYALLSGATYTGAIQTVVPAAGTESLILAASAGVDPSAPTSGSIWWNGTNLYFYNGSTNTDLLAGGGGLAWGDSITSSSDADGVTVTISDTGISSNGFSALKAVVSGTRNQSGFEVSNALGSGYVTTAGATYGDGSSFKSYNNSSQASSYSSYLESNKANAKTYGRLLDLKFSDTQSNSDIAAQIDLGTSAQGHTGLKIKATGNSSTQTGLEIDMVTTGAGIAMKLNSQNTNGTSAKLLEFATPNSTNGYAGLLIGMSTGVVDESNVNRLVYLPIQQTASAGNLGTRTDPVWDLRFQQNLNRAQTTTQDFDAFSFQRTSVTNNASANLTAQGSVARFENVSTQTTGTLTDTVAVLEVIQDNDSSGGHIKFNAYSGTPTDNNVLYYDGTNFKYRDNAGTLKTITAT